MRTHVDFNDAHERWAHPIGWRPAFEVFPRPSIWPRIVHFLLSGIVCLGFFGVVLWAVQRAVGG